MVGRVQVKPTSQLQLHELGGTHVRLILGAFLASHNPARTDLLRFFRSAEDRRKKKGGGTRKAAASKRTQVLTLLSLWSYLADSHSLHPS